ncbi:hypothetical protein BFAG_02722 [Bacteroides fragilis 3_1_12]|uniref:Uncharacterized protein n=1 Tax=Bacteroides fragilis 3_1_12 TaxID=457424 RepID=A0ABN0BM96_BACFG|nr:hypothetical protein BFAG_02722 [Bacteroides fragilis 3_1_12]
MIFHLPPFNDQLLVLLCVNKVEDAFLRPFIFHLYLPSSTLFQRGWLNVKYLGVR